MIAIIHIPTTRLWNFSDKPFDSREVAWCQFKTWSAYYKSPLGSNFFIHLNFDNYFTFQKNHTSIERIQVCIEEFEIIEI